MCAPLALAWKVGTDLAFELDSSSRNYPFLELSLSSASLTNFNPRATPIAPAFCSCKVSDHQPASVPVVNINDPTVALDYAMPESSDCNSSGRGAESTPSDTFDPLPNEDRNAPRRTRKRRRLSSGGDSSTATTPAEPLVSPPPTHDISRVPDHIPSLSHVAKQIQAAAAEAWDRRFQYNNVFALFLYWEDDNLQVAPRLPTWSQHFDRFTITGPIYGQSPPKNQIGISRSA